MENKELKNPMLNELEEDALSNVSGGTVRISTPHALTAVAVSI